MIKNLDPRAGTLRVIQQSYETVDIQNTLKSTEIEVKECSYEDYKGFSGNANKLVEVYG